jgi:N-acetylglucosamine malate deacetylase 1
MEWTRRSLIVRGGIASGAVALGGVSSIAASPKPRKTKVIVAGGHPGDPEYGCGGTIASLVEQGHEVILLYLNDGAWPPTSATTRLAEAKRACELLGARPAYAGQRNGAAIVDNVHYEAFARHLDAEAPDAVFTHWMIDNHRDHRATAMLTYDAWQKSGRKFALYYYEVSDGEDTMQFSPNRYVDITGLESRKRAACYAHASQTPERYYSLQDQVARFRGLASGYTRAEAFVWQEQSPFDILSRVPAV